MDKPKLRTPVISASLALIFWTLSVLVPGRTAQSILYGFTFIAGIVLLYSFVDHFTFYLARRIAQFNAAGVSGQTVLLDKWTERDKVILAMDFDQLQYAMKMRPIVTVVPGHHTRPVKTLTLENGVQASWDFVCEFFEMSQSDYLVEVRRWSEGSAKHRWADALTLSLIRNGYAIEAAGLHSAKWANASLHEEAEYAYGFRDE